MIKRIQPYTIEVDNKEKTRCVILRYHTHFLQRHAGTRTFTKTLEGSETQWISLREEMEIYIAPSLSFSWSIIAPPLMLP